MISRLKLMDFRCYGSFSWQIPQQGAIILGNNAQGKTSLLEAVCFLLRLLAFQFFLARLCQLRCIVFLVFTADILETLC